MNLANIRNRHLHWEDHKLFYSKMLLTELIPHEKYEKHYHLKFYWRDEKTPEFFNIYNARENARVYSLQHMSQSLSEGSQSDLNEVGATLVAQER